MDIRRNMQDGGEDDVDRMLRMIEASDDSDNNEFDPNVDGTKAMRDMQKEIQQEVQQAVESQNQISSAISRARNQGAVGDFVQHHMSEVNKSLSLLPTVELDKDINTSATGGSKSTKPTLPEIAGFISSLDKKSSPTPERKGAWSYNPSRPPPSQNPSSGSKLLPFSTIEERKRMLEEAKANTAADVSKIMAPYKAEFARRRMLSTICGGARFLLEDQPPCYVTLVQASLLAYCILVVLVPSLLYQLRVVSIYVAMGSASGLVLLFGAIMIPLSSVQKKAASDNVVKMFDGGGEKKGNGGGGGHLGDEDDFDFETCGGTFQLVMPDKQGPGGHVGQTMLQGFFAISVAALGQYYLAIDLRETSHWLFFIFSSLSIGISILHPLLIQNPVEVNGIASMEYEQLGGKYGIANWTPALGAYTRAVYALALIAVEWGYRMGSIPHIIGVAGRAIFASSLALYPLGVLPQLDVLLLWAFEQILIVLFGRSPAASVHRLVRMAALSAISSLVAACLYFTISEAAMVIYCTGFGYIVSLENIFPRTLCSPSGVVAGDAAAAAASNSSGETRCLCGSMSSSTVRLEKVFFVAICCVGAVIGVSMSGASSITVRSSTLRRTFELIIIALWCLKWVSGEIVRPYICGFFANPFVHCFNQPNQSTSPSRESPPKQRCKVKIIVADGKEAAPSNNTADPNVRAALTMLQQGKNQQQILRTLRSSPHDLPVAQAMRALQQALGEQASAAKAPAVDHPKGGDKDSQGGGGGGGGREDSTKRICCWWSPFTLLLGKLPLRTFMAVLISAYVCVGVTPNPREKILYSILVHGAATAAWQTTWKAADAAGVVAVLSFTGLSDSWGLRFSAAFMLSCMFVDRLRDLLRKLEYAVCLTVSHIVDPKLHTLSQATIITLSVLLAPIHFAVICVSSVLMAPVVPVFGLPIFLLGYPRPLRCLPSLLRSTSNHSNDASTPYYKQMLPSILAAIRRHVSSGMLSRARAGDFFALRKEPYFVWVQMLEEGNDYVIVTVKGLELQTTSCHTVEANVVDRIIENSVFADDGGGGDGGVCSKMLNPYPFNTAQPVGAIGIDSYEYTTGLMTGILDSRDFLDCLNKMFSVSLSKSVHEAIYNGKVRDAVKWGSIPAEQGGGRGEANAKSLSEIDDEKQPGHCILKSLPSEYGVLSPEQERLWKRVTTAVVTSFKHVAYRTGVAASVLPWKKSGEGTVATSSRKGDEYDIRSRVRSACSRFHHGPSKSSGASKEFIDWMRGCRVVVASESRGRRAGTSTSPPLSSSSSSLPSISLLDLSIEAYRIAFKCAYDLAIEGEAPRSIASRIGTDPTLFKSILARMQNFKDEGWFIGPETSSSWSESVESGVPHLFSISEPTSLSKPVRYHLAEVRRSNFGVVTLNPSAIRAVWAALSLELVYFTNDDDERYSTQSHGLLLRNLTVQSADPLGYSSFVSTPLSVER